MTNLSEGQVHRKRLVAYHEAGHAVIGYRFGQRYGEISIMPEPQKQRDGYCRFWWNLDDPQEQILVLFAGHAAQKVYDPNDESDPSITDYKEVWRLSEGMPREEYRGLFIESEKLVEDNQGQIQAVAEALLECETLVDGAWACIIEGVDNGTDWRQSKEWIVFKEFHQD